MASAAIARPMVPPVSGKPMATDASQTGCPRPPVPSRPGVGHGRFDNKRMQMISQYVEASEQTQQEASTRRVHKTSNELNMLTGSEKLSHKYGHASTDMSSNAEQPTSPSCTKQESGRHRSCTNAARNTFLCRPTLVELCNRMVRLVPPGHKDPPSAAATKNNCSGKIA